MPISMPTVMAVCSAPRCRWSAISARRSSERRVRSCTFFGVCRWAVSTRFCSIRANFPAHIAYGREGASAEDVRRAAREANIAEFIENLPLGYDTPVTDGGVNFSKGQKQLMTIARAMLSEAPMLIMDEATSNVDTRTELLIHDAMAKLMQNKTCFVIAHRLSTVVGADLILVVKDGDIVEYGRHEELLQKNGFYAGIYAAQFE